MAHPSLQRTIHVVNTLAEKILIVHCRSKDDDLGGHAVAVNESVSWSFEPNLFWGTHFWCNLAVEDKRISLVAYDEESEYKTDYWFVCDDGVYGRDRVTGVRTYKAAWKRVWPRW
ncbi:unnamed protein product [Linum tenue]|uniref:S-protein homolog n=1 Tax=Linum tenue TaxID=586396 RepID=A0AAV0KZR3_9ROSI|nr:unnamed protein product [Linum tenue]